MKRTSAFAATTALMTSLMLPDTAVMAQGVAVEEIVVTARKRDESIQDIPLSVTALSASQIRDQAITDVEDALQFIPGVHMSNHTANRNNPAIRFRGIEPPSSIRSDQTSASFLDGVYLPTGSQMVSMDDIQRLEVVKGPQSAFFGRSTFGGAINFITKTPGNESRSDVNLILGDNARADLWLGTEGPIIEDKLFFRASGRYYTYDGAWKNEHPSGGDLGAQQTNAGSLTLYATPTEDLTIKARYMHTVLDDGLAVQFLAKGERNNCGPFTTNGVRGTATYYCGTLTRDLVSNGIRIDTSPLGDTSIKSDLGLDRKFNFGSLNIDWDLGGSGYTVTSVSGIYRESTEELRELLTDEILVHLRWKDKSFSQELRLASPGEDKLRWMVGGYYLDLTYNNDAESGFPCPGTGPFCRNPVTGIVARRGGSGTFPQTPGVTDKVKNKAVFASLGYDVTEQFTISGEFRYEVEKLANGTPLIQEAMPTNPADPVRTARPLGGASIDVAGTFKAKLPRVILDYKLSEDTLLYASYAKGNNPGGFNAEVIQLEPTVAFPAFFALDGIGYTVKQAGLKAYEAGAKHTFADGKGTLNGAAYFMEWTNQRFRGFTRNVDSNGDGRFVLGSDRIGGQVDYDSNGITDLWGFEVSGNYVLGENWVASVSYNFNDSDIKVYRDAVNARVYGNADASAFKVPRSPKHAATFALDYTTPAATMFGQDGEWFGRWDAWYQGSTFTWTVNLAKTEAAALHNLRAGWRNDSYSISAWVENVTDDDSVLAAQRTTGSFLTGTLGFQFTLPEPRTFGLTLSASF